MTNTLAYYSKKLYGRKVTDIDKHCSLSQYRIRQVKTNTVAYYNTELQRKKVTYIEKHSSLLNTEIIKLVKSFIVQAQGGSVNQRYFFYKLIIIKNVNKSTTTKA